MVKLLSTAALFGVALAQYNTTSLPTVDLGYEIHQASNFNVGHRTSVTWDRMLTYTVHRWFLQLLEYQICSTTGWQPEIRSSAGPC